MARSQGQGPDRVTEKASELGETYRRIGWIVVAALVGVAILAGLGVTSPGWFTPGVAFLLLGGATVVLAVATVAVLFSLRRTFEVLETYGEALESHKADLSQHQASGQADSERIDELAETVQTLERTVQRLKEEGEVTQTPQASATSAPSGPSPFGDVHEVEDVEGIGEGYGRALRSVDIADTEALWNADPEAVAEELDVSPKVSRRWQAQAELMALQDVGPQYAELLVRAGITSIDELASLDPETVEAAIEAKEDELDVSIQRGQIGRSTIERWIERAEEHDPGGMRTYR